MKKTSKLLIPLHYQLAQIDALHQRRQRFRFLWEQCERMKSISISSINKRVLNAALREVRKQIYSHLH